MEGMKGGRDKGSEGGMDAKDGRRERSYLRGREGGRVGGVEGGKIN